MRGKVTLTALLALYGNLLWSIPVQAQNGKADASPAAIETARQKVYPALVNIACVTRYFSGGRSLRAPSGGSGVIINEQGYVLTNYHVAGNATRITCTLPDGEAIDAKVLLHDPATDLSVLQLLVEKRKDPKAKLPSAVLGDSSALQIGDAVMAMGNPMMLASSMTLGIVSNTKRVFTDFTNTQIAEQELDDGETTGQFTRWIQHDALILPGNSGGPLVNLKGEVVGINELGGGGVGFAIPANIAREVLAHVGKGESIERAWLGVTVLPVSKIGRDTGALVASVWPNSPAAKAGLVPGDILTAVNDKPVQVRFFEEVPLFQQMVAALPVGSSVSLKFLRNEAKKTTSATVAKMARSLGREEEYREVGLTVQEITEPMAMTMRLASKRGMLVTGVRPGYAIEGALPPIQAGDVIVSVAGKPTLTPEAFKTALLEAQKESFAVTFRRKKEEFVSFVKITGEKQEDPNTELPKAWLGLKTQVMTPEIAKALNMADVKGFRITEVMPMTAAAKAGLKEGDVIVKINNDKMTASRPQDAEDLKRVVEDLPVGEKAEFTVLRGGKEQKLATVMEPMPAGSDTAKKAKQKEFEFSVRDLSPMDRIEKRLAADAKGVLVTEAIQGGWANVAGLLVDDQILSINDKPVTDTVSFEAVLKDILAKRPKVVQIFVRRDGRTHFVFIEPDWAKLLNG